MKVRLLLLGVSRDCLVNGVLLEHDWGAVSERSGFLSFFDNCDTFRSIARLGAELAQQTAARAAKYSALAFAKLHEFEKKT